MGISFKGRETVKIATKPHHNMLVKNMKIEGVINIVKGVGGGGCTNVTPGTGPPHFRPFPSGPLPPRNSFAEIFANSPQKSKKLANLTATLYPILSGEGWGSTLNPKAKAFPS